MHEKIIWQVNHAKHQSDFEKIIREVQISSGCHRHYIKTSTSVMVVGKQWRKWPFNQHQTHLASSVQLNLILLLFLWYVCFIPNPANHRGVSYTDAEQHICLWETHLVQYELDKLIQDFMKPAHCSGSHQFTLKTGTDVLYQFDYVTWFAQDITASLFIVVQIKQFL